MYFPIMVDEALMVEPTETESKETMDEAVQIYLDLYEKAYFGSASFENRSAQYPHSPTG
jgi:glycine dehydrogenase subunit 2